MSCNILNQDLRYKYDQGESQGFIAEEFSLHLLSTMTKLLC